MTSILIIVPTARLEEARQIAVTQFEQVAEETFVPCGSPTGANPPTHYWLRGQFRPEAATKLAQLAPSLPWAEVHTYDIKTNITFPLGVRDNLGLLPISELPA